METIQLTITLPEQVRPTSELARRIKENDLIRHYERLYAGVNKKAIVNIAYKSREDYLKNSLTN